MKNIGTNLNSPSFHSTQYAFVNLAKNLDNWRIKKNGKIIRDYPFESVDENGYVKVLNPDDSLFASVDYDRSLGIDTYIVRFEGEAQIKYKNAELIEKQKGYQLIKVDLNSNRRIGLQISKIDPNNHLRNLSITPQGIEGTFNPNFLDFLKTINLSTLRFMDWMETNNSHQKEWNDRPRQDTYTYFKYGVPVEVMVELYNILHVNSWFCMPHLATDEYIRNFARYVKENLNPELKIYLEYSNELWNMNFQQAEDNEAEAEKEGRDWKELFADKTVRVAKIWKEVLCSQSKRLIVVLGGRATSPRQNDSMLRYLQVKGDIEYIDRLAIAPYFGGKIFKSDHYDCWRKLLEEKHNLVDCCFEELRSGNLLASTIEEGEEVPKSLQKGGNAIDNAMAKVKENLEIVQGYGIKLIAYEGGQHLVAGKSRDKAMRRKLINLVAEVNRDERMGELYQEYFKQWYELCGDDALFCNFTDIKKSGKSGAWGLVENVGDSSPKLEGLLKVVS